MSELCPNKAICGSCSWSHIPYSKQLKQKLSDINGSFAIKGLDLHCDHILPSPVTEHYRNRMDFVIDFEGRVGMRQKDKWWKVIDAHTCFLADKLIERLFHHVREWTQSAEISFYDRKSKIGLLRYAVIRSTTLGETMITIVTSTPNSDEISKLRTELHHLAKLTDVTTCIWSINSTETDLSFGETIEIISGPGYIEETICDNRYRVSPNAFFQTNPYGAKLLLETVTEFCGDLKNSTLIDLYCGSGFFAVALAGGAKKTIGVEMIKEAIADAKVNAQINGKTVEFFDAKTEETDWNSFNADVVILDPPRSGMHDKTLNEIIAHPPKHIIYISCNYKNFAREMVQLQKIFNVEDMWAIDMFPHTPHVELVTNLIKK